MGGKADDLALYSSVANYLYSGNLPSSKDHIYDLSHSPLLERKILPQKAYKK
jgi:hypothetical protein